MPRPIDLSIIIPAYREAGVIQQSLETLSAFLKSNELGEVEVLVVVPDSPDGTADLARAKKDLFEHFRVIDAGQRQGKGRDVRLGMFEAKGRYRLFMDADLATPLNHILDVKSGMDKNADVLIAVRDLPKIHKGILRKFMSTFGNICAQVLVLPGIKDTQCGFKAFRADVAEEVFSRQTMLGWSFDAEVLKIARLKGHKITTIEAPDWKEPKAEGMGLVGDSPMKAAIQTLLDLVVIRWNVITGKYKNVNYTHEAQKEL